MTLMPSAFSTRTYSPAGMIQVRITAHTMIENTIMKLCGTRNFFLVAIVNIPPFYNVVSLYNIIPVAEKVCNFVFSNASLKKS